MLAHPVFLQKFNTVTQISKIWKKYPRFYVSVPHGKHQFKTKEVTMDMQKCMLAPL